MATGNKGIGDLNPVTGLKRCSHCAEKKPATAFSRQAGRRDGLRNYCKECRRDFYIANEREEAFLRRMRLRAIEKGVPFSITMKDIFIPDNCPLARCGHRLLAHGVGIVNPASPSMDRYDPSLGYIPGNVWIICNECNLVKQNLTGEGHISFGIDLIDSFRRERERIGKE